MVGSSWGSHACAAGTKGSALLMLALAGACSETAPPGQGMLPALANAGTSASAAGNGVAQGGSNATPITGGTGVTSGAGGISAVPIGGSTAPAAGGSGGSAATAGVGGTAGANAAAGNCGTNLLPNSDDPGVRGAWDVGARTAKIGRLTVEVFYPAESGSTAGKPEATYDLSKWLPPAEQAKIPEAGRSLIGPNGGHLYRDVPIDAAHGPYPLVIFVHGTASMRAASVTLNTHWASRGLVVLAADYPGLGLEDQLNATECGYPQTGVQDIASDVEDQLAALANPTGEIAFLAGRIDTTRVGLSGHSQGGCVSSTLSATPNVQIVIPISASTPTDAGPSLKSIMYVGGIDDTVIGYDSVGIGNTVCPNFAVSVTTGYETSLGPPELKRRLVGIAGGGHLVPTDLCQENSLGRNAIDEAQTDGVCGINTAVILGLPALFDCGTVDRVKGMDAINYATTAALEETLHCKDRSAAFQMLRTKHPEIGDFQEQ